MNPNPVLLLLSELKSEVVFILLVQEDPLVAELVVEHFFEIGCLQRVDILQNDSVWIKNASQDDQSVLDLEVLELVDVVVRRIVLHLDESEFSLEKNRLVELEQLPVLGSLVSISQFLFNFA